MSLLFLRLHSKKYKIIVHKPNACSAKNECLVEKFLAKNLYET